MRAADFLLEYNQAVTIQKMGDVLAQAAQKDPTAKRYALYVSTNPELQTPEVLSKVVLDKLESTDPTQNKQYVQWLARLYANSWNKPNPSGRGMWLEDVMSTIAQYLHKYHELNRRKMLPRPENDINSFRDFNTFMYDMDQYQLPEKEEVDKGNAFTLYEDDIVRVIIPTDQSAACYYGRGTRWCTAATKGENYFNHYNSIAPLLIVLPKEPENPGEKYQVHFGVAYSDGFSLTLPLKSDGDFQRLVDELHDDYLASGNSRYINSDDSDDEIIDDIAENLEYGQLMDEQDDPVEYSWFVNRIGENTWHNILNAYLKKFPDRRWQVHANLDKLSGSEWL